MIISNINQVINQCAAKNHQNLSGFLDANFMSFQCREFILTAPTAYDISLQRTARSQVMSQEKLEVSTNCISSKMLDFINDAATAVSSGFRWSSVIPTCFLLALSALILNQTDPVKSSTSSPRDMDRTLTPCWKNADPMVQGIRLKHIDLSESNEIHFLVVGDWGIIGLLEYGIIDGDPDVQYDLAKAMNEYVSTVPIQFILSIGDHFYPYGVNTTDDPRWLSTFESVYNLEYLQHLRWYGVMGNHDYYGNEIRFKDDSDESSWDSFSVTQIKYTNYRSKLTKRYPWCMPSYFYSFSVKLQDFTVRFVGIDTVILTLCSIENHPFCRGRSLSSPDITKNMLFWFEEELKRSVAANDLIVVFGHNPMFAIGTHKNHKCETQGGDANNMDILATLLMKYNVSLYLHGHDHLSQIITGYPNSNDSGNDNRPIMTVCTGSMGRLNTKICDEPHDYTKDQLRWKINYYSKKPAFSAVKIDQDRIVVEMRNVHNQIIATHSLLRRDRRSDEWNWFYFIVAVAIMSIVYWTWRKNGRHELR